MESGTPLAGIHLGRASFHLSAAMISSSPLCKSLGALSAMYHAAASGLPVA